MTDTIPWLSKEILTGNNEGEHYGQKKDINILQLEEKNLSLYGESKSLQKFIELYSVFSSCLDIYISVINEDVEKALLGVHEL